MGDIKKDVPVMLSFNPPEMYGNQLDDDALKETFTLNSWSPPLLILIPITLGLILLCSQLLRRSRDDERSLMLSAYAGCALLGVSTHYGLGAIPNIVMSFASIVWLALITGVRHHMNSQPSCLTGKIYCEGVVAL